MPDIVVLGSLNMDLVVRTAQMPRPGETVRGSGFATIPGGKGANQAAAAARLGAQVEMVGRVGQDPFGPAILANMRSQGVGVSQVKLDADAPSGVAVIILDAQGENAIVVAPGANDRVTVDDIHAMRDLLAGSRYLVTQFETPLPVVQAAIRLANELGVPVILNAAPALTVDADVLHGVHVLIVNESEAQALTGSEVGSLTAAGEAGRQLSRIGIPIVILTLGARGALLVTPERAVHVPARQVQVVDTTAAGDAFVGALAVALLRGMDLVEATRYATCAGTLATMTLGAQPSLPSAERVQAFYEGSPAFGGGPS